MSVPPEKRGAARAHAVAKPRAADRIHSAPSPPPSFDPANDALANGLPDSLKSSLEAMSGLAMENVQIHRNSPQPAELGAAAYTRGSEIHVEPGHYRHLPHEAWHVVQQKQGRVRATAQTKGLSINDDGGLEEEADRMGAASAGMKDAAAHVSPAPNLHHVARPLVERDPADDSGE